MTKVSNTPVQGSGSSIVELDLAVLAAVAGGGRDPDSPSDLDSEGGDPTVG